MNAFGTPWQVGGGAGGRSDAAGRNGPETGGRGRCEGVRWHGLLPGGFTKKGPRTCRCATLKSGARTSRLNFHFRRLEAASHDIDGMAGHLASLLAQQIARDGVWERGQDSNGSRLSRR